MTDAPILPRIDAAILRDRQHPDRPKMLRDIRRAATETGFMTLTNTVISSEDILSLTETYRAFFTLPAAAKSTIDMARTGANRGWGAPRSEQVDPASNPDYKEVFDCGFELPEDDPDARLAVYAPNLWPDQPERFRETVQAYYAKAGEVALMLLGAVAEAIGEPGDFFDSRFSKPMALLRGNYYPARPDWAGDKDFGIAAHTDYGCLTLLATDGAPGLEVQLRDGSWLAVQVPVGDFVINFGEMLEMWTGGRVVATPHRVKGTAGERISIPLFFNPNFDTNVAPIGSGQTITAGDHLTRRFNETYLHLKTG
ncbi:isopenicillin N synthase family dioxygenase [Nioella nitratireducens]|uniref:isopenicillin N synthase family dioxygenase n=1 Tax=Nioella nitratireducens TaxID=1287720 RepID=UPI000A838F8E|nr:2-oxoglutarate and iron-dependent oxygenase domain-containing protein [Nioella nitratireducens]